MWHQNTQKTSKHYRSSKEKDHYHLAKHYQEMALPFSGASSNPCQVEAPPEHRPIVFPEVRPSSDRRKSSSPLLPSKVDNLKKTANFSKE
jgi:hypothetical protein